MNRDSIVGTVLAAARMASCSQGRLAENSTAPCATTNTLNLRSFEKAVRFIMTVLGGNEDEEDAPYCEKCQVLRQCRTGWPLTLDDHHRRLWDPVRMAGNKGTVV